MQWLKDGQPLRTGSRVRLLTKEHIKITSVTKEDRGMYQCFVRNDYDAVQSTAEMRLGGKFIFRSRLKQSDVVIFRLSALKTLITHLSW